MEEATIIIKKVGERFYLAQTEEGNVYQRNRKFLKATAYTEKGKQPNTTTISGEVEAPLSNPIADTETLNPSTSNSQQTLLLDDHGTIDPIPNDTVTNPSSEDKDKLSNAKPFQDPKVTTTHSGRHVKTPSRFCDFVTL